MNYIIAFWYAFGAVFGIMLAEAYMRGSSLGVLLCIAGLLFGAFEAVNAHDVKAREIAEAMRRHPAGRAR